MPPDSPEGRLLFRKSPPTSCMNPCMYIEFVCETHFFFVVFVCSNSVYLQPAEEAESDHELREGCQGHAGQGCPPKGLAERNCLSGRCDDVGLGWPPNILLSTASLKGQTPNQLGLWHLSLGLGVWVWVGVWG